MMELHSGTQQGRLQIIPFLFKVPLCLVAMHFTATSYSFEILCLFIISLLWEAALLLLTFVVQLTSAGVADPTLGPRERLTWNPKSHKHFYVHLNPYLITKWTVCSEVRAGPRRTECSYRYERNKPCLAYFKHTSFCSVRP